MNKVVGAWIVFVVLLSGFIFVSKYEDRPFLRALDFSVTVKVQERIDTSTHLRVSAFVGNLMEGATFFAGPEFTVVVALLLTGLFVYDRKKKIWNVKALIIPIALVAIVVMEIYGKSIVHHPSPPFNMIKHPTTIFPADYINDQFSYPSGHAARAVFMAVLAAAYLIGRFGTMGKRYSGMILVVVSAYVMLVSVSRIYLGHHWFSDVVGGLLLGGAWACAGIASLARKE